MRGAWETPAESCPYCGKQCEAEFANVDVGMVQVSPYHCDFCGATEIGSYDCSCVKPYEDDPEEHLSTCRMHGVTRGELECGWYAPLSPKELEGEVWCS